MVSPPKMNFFFWNGNSERIFQVLELYTGEVIRNRQWYQHHSISNILEKSVSASHGTDEASEYQ